MSEQRVEVVACTEADMDFTETCGACGRRVGIFEPQGHERFCVQARDRIIDEKLYAQALEDGRIDDAREIGDIHGW